METLKPCLSEAQRHKRLLWEIAALAVLLRLLSLIFAHIATLDSDAFEYGEIARNILNGAGYSFDMYGSAPLAPTAWMAPLYTYLLAGYARLLGANLLGMGVIQALAGGLVCWSLGWLGRQVSGDRVGLLAAISFAIYPEAVFMSSKFVPEPWLLVFELLFLLSAILYLRSERRLWLVLTGVLAGLAALTKESALLYPLLFLVWVWLKKQPSRRLVFDSVLVLVIIAGILGPWSVRNYVTWGRFIPVRTGFWYNAWRGNHPGATGTPRGWNKDLIEFSLDPGYAEAINSSLTGGEMGYEDAYRKFALDYIRENPWRFIGLSFRRFWYFWTIDPTHPLAGRPVYWAPWFILLGLAGVGVAAVRKRWRDYFFWYLLILSTTVVYSLTLVLPRYRLPLLPGLMLLAAEGVNTIWNNWRDRKSIIKY